MFRKKHSRRSSNPLFVIFRLILSLTMFVVLLTGGYSAYKHFSGLDPLKLDPQAVLSNLIQVKTPEQFIAILTSLKIDPKILGITKKDNVIPLDNLTDTASSASFSFLLVADSHNDNQNLKKAIVQAKSAHPNLAFIIGLGDYTDVGTVSELNAAKKELDLSGLRYFLVAGDHDLWDSRNMQNPPDANFKAVFGPLYQSFTYNNYKFLLLDNSDNYTGFSKDQLDFVTSELEKGKQKNMRLLVFLHEPLYHPSSDHYMGKTEASLKSQAQAMIFQLKQADVKKVFAGDIHYFSEYEEPITKIPMVTVGALVTDRNPQASRYAVITVYGNGDTQVDDVEIK